MLGTMAAGALANNEGGQITGGHAGPATSGTGGGDHAISVSTGGGQSAAVPSWVWPVTVVAGLSIVAGTVLFR